MPKVCVIGTRGIPCFVGGIETICEHLYPGIMKARSDFDITILSRITYQGKTEYEYNGVKVKALKAVNISGLETFIHTLFALIYARLFVHPELVHLHGIGPGFFSPVSRLLGFKTIVTHHSPDYKRPKWRWHGKFILKLGELATVLFAHRIICVSQSVLDEVNEKYFFLKRKRTVIRNAGSLINYRSAHSKILSELGIRANQYILAVGRLDKTKGFDDLIAAFNMSNVEHLKLVIVGSNYVEDEYVKSLTKHACERIVFAGTRVDDELTELYKNASLLVNPSYMEGFCLVLAEALSVGIPIVASDIAPHKEFELNKTSYFERGDVYGLAAKLNVKDYLFYKNTYAETLQQQNTWEVNIQKHIELFESLL